MYVASVTPPVKSTCLSSYMSSIKAELEAHSTVLSTVKLAAQGQPYSSSNVAALCEVLTWPPGRCTVWKVAEPLRGGVLLEEVNHWWWVMWFHSLIPLLALSASWWSVKIWHLPVTIFPCYDGLSPLKWNQNKQFPSAAAPQVFGYSNNKCY